jgi:L-lactate dehydrogenase complex protein LldF
MKIVDQAANAVSFVEDMVHESHFDRIIWMLRTRRDQAARQVPEWERLRDLTSQIKEQTLSKLGDYLEEFEASAIKRGVHVHWARDAHEHNEILYSILADHKVKTLIKSKSMLTEKCDTRPYLQRRSITVTETDLGERIQQLADEPPAHIVGPAWQKTNEDIAELFAKKYGSDPNNTDAAYLAGRCGRTPAL